MPHAPLALAIALATVLLAFAVPAGVAGLRGWSGRLDRKGRLGLHTEAALASDEAFALANRVAAPLVIGAGTVGALCAVLVLALPIGTAGAIVVAVLGLAGVFGQLAAGSRIGDRAARAVPRPARKPGGGSCCGGCGCGDSGCSGSRSSSGTAGSGGQPGHAASDIPDLLPDATLR